VKFLSNVSFKTPSPDTTLSLYHVVLSQAVDLEEALCELEELRAENEREDIELDKLYKIASHPCLLWKLSSRVFKRSWSRSNRSATRWVSRMPLFFDI
jgi:hypothetical protein